MLTRELAMSMVTLRVYNNGYFSGYDGYLSGDYGA